MDKILTVVIPTYNMESYLEKCLDSVLVEQVIGLIEVMIVNDGSKDSSLLIAKRYQNRYPGSIVVVDKKNGNYGSCLNLAFSLAKGKYIRTLDADDCFDSIELVKFIEKLCSLPENIDLVLTNYVVNIVGTGKSRLIKQKGFFEKIYNHIIDFEKNGIIYHREGIHGDYDEFDDIETLIEYIKTGDSSLKNCRDFQTASLHRND